MFVVRKWLTTRPLNWVVLNRNSTNSTNNAEDSVQRSEVGRQGEFRIGNTGDAKEIQRVRGRERVESFLKQEACFIKFL